ncbi:hypothetical protein BGZ46_009603 [Entomortierella lignicola]|nr:hypothetical protein BGZ46_009603 [Entomortierella lignicola]
MRFSAVAAAASFLGAVLAQTTTPAPTISVAITHPVATDVWTVGKSAVVDWVALVPNLPNNGNVSVELFHGQPAHQTLVQALGNGVLQLKIAAVPTVPADWYSVRINSDSYSHYFFIANATVKTPLGPEPSANATTSAALPSSTAAATTTVANITSTAPTSTPTTTKASAGNSLAAGSLAAGAAVVAAFFAL